MKEIKLTRGKFVIVDDDDFEYLNQWKWYAVKKSNRFYAVRMIGTSRTDRKMTYMHRLILSISDTHILVDHADRNTLNCQRSNLRVCTYSQNATNKCVQSNSTTGFSGVSYFKPRKKYRARIQLNGKEIHIGYFENINDAVIARDNAAKIYHGEFAFLNTQN